MQVLDAKTLKEYKKKYNFFATNAALSAKAADLLDTGRDLLVLDPSAGLGALLKAAKEAMHHTAKFHYCEIQDVFHSSLRDFEYRGNDFMEYNPGQMYDAIIMNPPYRNRQAISHTEHAWKCLKSGGRIVTIVNRAAMDYIMEEFQGYMFHCELIKKGFAETNIETYLILIIRPVYE